MWPAPRRVRINRGSARAQQVEFRVGQPSFRAQGIRQARPVQVQCDTIDAKGAWNDGGGISTAAAGAGPGGPGAGGSAPRPSRIVFYSAGAAWIAGAARPCRAQA